MSELFLICGMVSIIASMVCLYKGDSQNAIYLFAFSLWLFEKSDYCKLKKGLENAVSDIRKIDNGRRM